MYIFWEIIHYDIGIMQFFSNAVLMYMYGLLSSNPCTLLFPSPCVAGRSRVTATAVARGGYTEEGAPSFFHSLSGLLGVRDPPSTSLTESTTEDVSKSKGPANPDESYRAIWIPGTCMLRPRYQSGKGVSIRYSFSRGTLAIIYWRSLNLAICPKSGRNALLAEFKFGGLLCYVIV